MGYVRSIETEVYGTVLDVVTRLEALGSFCRFRGPRDPVYRDVEPGATGSRLKGEDKGREVLFGVQYEWEWTWREVGTQTLTTTQVPTS